MSTGSYFLLLFPLHHNHDFCFFLHATLSNAGGRLVHRQDGGGEKWVGGKVKDEKRSDCGNWVDNGTTNECRFR